MKFKRKYRNKITIKRNTIEAIQYNVENLNDVLKFVGYGNALWNPMAEELWLVTHIGHSIVKNGFYVVKKQGVGVYPLAPNVFHKIYEEEV